MSGRGIMIGSSIAWTEACQGCPPDLPDDQVGEWVGQRFMALMDQPPERLTPGTLAAVARIYPGQSMPALKMAWQRFKRCATSQGWPPRTEMTALPWSASIARQFRR